MTTCCLCGTPADLDPVFTGQDLGTVHRACFIEMDVRDELEEHRQVDAAHAAACLPPRPARHTSREARR